MSRLFNRVNWNRIKEDPVDSIFALFFKSLFVLGDELSEEGIHPHLLACKTC